MSPVYRPAEDSLLLFKHAESRLKGDILDMGTGSGFLAVCAIQHPKVSRVVAVDVDPKSIKAARIRAEIFGVNIDARLGDLFKPVQGETFDLILFNPPYLPSEGKIDEPSWSGGEKGYEIITRFLIEAPCYLNEKGAVLMVYSTHSNLLLDKWDNLYYIEVLEELSLFYERLICVLLRPR